VVLNLQADEFIRVAAGCLACDRRLGIKDTKQLAYRTMYGKAILRSPRFYSRCGTCGFVSGDGATISRLAHALKERTHPQWTRFQCRYASVMSYRLAKIYLRDAFPDGKDWLAPGAALCEIHRLPLTTLKAWLVRKSNNLPKLLKRVERQPSALDPEIAPTSKRSASLAIDHRGENVAERRTELVARR
jgi:hypothetical protein